MVRGQVLVEAAHETHEQLVRVLLLGTREVGPAPPEGAEQVGGDQGLPARPAAEHPEQLACDAGGGGRICESGGRGGQRPHSTAAQPHFPGIPQDSLVGEEQLQDRGHVARGPQVRDSRHLVVPGHLVEVVGPRAPQAVEEDAVSRELSEPAMGRGIAVAEEGCVATPSMSALQTQSGHGRPGEGGRRGRTQVTPVLRAERSPRRGRRASKHFTTLLDLHPVGGGVTSGRSYDEDQF